MTSTAAALSKTKSFVADSCSSRWPLGVLLIAENFSDLRCCITALYLLSDRLVLASGSIELADVEPVGTTCVQDLQSSVLSDLFVASHKPRAPFESSMMRSLL